MARFYGSLTGQAKTTATRRGGTNSGVKCHVRGWHVGIEVEVKPDPNNPDEDRVYVHLTSGSANQKSGKSLGSYTIKDLPL